MRPSHHIWGTVPKSRTVLNSFTKTGINSFKLDLIISFLILSEKEDLSFLSFPAAVRISQSVMR